MFIHHGKARTLRHNKQIASLLSFVAGIVNLAGYLSVRQLTTNVTGHFAFFVDELFKLQFSQSIAYLLYILFFFSGSFVSSFLVEIMKRKSEKYIYLLPILIESMLLFIIALNGEKFISINSNIIAFSMLFAMGLQNSLVTRISNAMVRTTHLTGLFTDLGIELSQLFFNHTREQRESLISTILLRLRIISFFFIGGIAGSVLYSTMSMYALIVPATLLLLGLLYDYIKYKLSNRSIPAP